MLLCKSLHLIAIIFGSLRRAGGFLGCRRVVFRLPEIAYFHSSIRNRISAITASQKAGMAALVVFFVTGFVLLMRVRE